MFSKSLTIFWYCYIIEFFRLGEKKPLNIIQTKTGHCSRTLFAGFSIESHLHDTCFTIRWYNPFKFFYTFFKNFPPWRKFFKQIYKQTGWNQKHRLPSSSIIFLYFFFQYLTVRRSYYFLFPFRPSIFKIPLAGDAFSIVAFNFLKRIFAPPKKIVSRCLLTTILNLI